MIIIKEESKVKPIYVELQSYSRNVPTQLTILQAPIWEQYHNRIDELNTMTGLDYSRFKVSIKTDEFGYRNISKDEYRQQLDALISRLHVEYLSDEQPPFSSTPSPSPSMIVNQQQSQQQTMTVTLLEVQDKINQKLSQTTDEKEKTFLQKLKEQLGTISSVMQLISLILNIAHQTGTDINTVRTLLA